MWIKHNWCVDWWSNKWWKCHGWWIKIITKMPPARKKKMMEEEEEEDGICWVFKCSNLTEFVILLLLLAVYYYTRVSLHYSLYFYIFSLLCLLPNQKNIHFTKTNSHKEVPICDCVFWYIFSFFSFITPITCCHLLCVNLFL